MTSRSPLLQTQLPTSPQGCSTALPQEPKCIPAPLGGVWGWKYPREQGRGGGSAEQGSAPLMLEQQRRVREGKVIGMLGRAGCISNGAARALKINSSQGNKLLFPGSSRAPVLLSLSRSFWSSVKGNLWAGVCPTWMWLLEDPGGGLGCSCCPLSKGRREGRNCSRVTSPSWPQGEGESRSKQLFTERLMNVLPRWMQSGFLAEGGKGTGAGEGERGDPQHPKDTQPLSG